MDQEWKSLENDHARSTRSEQLDIRGVSFFFGERPQPASPCTLVTAARTQSDRSHTV